MDTWTTIKVLYGKEVPIKTIAKQLGLSKNTVKKYLRQDEPPVFKKSQNFSKSKWEDYKDEIIVMYYKKKLIGSRIFNDLKDKGARGSESGFYEYLKHITKSDISNKIRERFETGPGQQAQFDWSEYTVRISSIVTKIYIFCTILGYSRMKYFFASLDMTQHSIFESIEHALRYFGGSPCELLSDNAKQMVTNADPKNFKWNEKYTTFLGYYGIDPKACKVRHPYTKGKVENPFKYLENHFIKGNSFENFKDLFTSLECFTHKVNKKKHEGINGIPWERFEEEKKYLQHLPELNYIGIHEEWRKATFDCLVSFEGNKYSVPYPYASKSVWVRSHRGFYVQIFAQSGKLIATHQKPKGKGHIIINNSHYDGLRKSNPGTIVGMKEKFLSLYPEYELFIDKLQASKRLNFRTHLSKIIHLNNIYAIDDIKKALKSAIEVNVLSFDYIFAFLTGNCDIEQRVLVKMDNKQNLESNEEVFRNLSYYDSIQ